MEICTLCLEDIKVGEETIIIDGILRHKGCSDDLDRDIAELASIYEETCGEDI